MIVDWTVGFRLESEAGTLLLNQETPGLGWFILNDRKCSTGVPVRVTSDDVPQGHGRIRHARWWAAYEAHLAIQMWETPEQPACDEVLQQMGDELARHINALMIQRTAGLGARLFWLPTGYLVGSTPMERMMRDVQLSSGRTFSAEDNEVEFDIDCELPYAMDSEETVTALSDGVPVTITNPGSTDFLPVFRIDGATSAFTLENASVLDPAGNPLQVVYDDTLPGAVAIGGGDYLEIDFFRNTAYLNGSGADRISGIDIRVSDFFPIVPGPNSITLTGASGTAHTNGAWA